MQLRQRKTQRRQGWVRLGQGGGAGRFKWLKLARDGGLLGATLFVFAEMLGSFAAALVLGVPGRFFVITTSIWQATLSFPPDYGRAAAMGIELWIFGVVHVPWFVLWLVLPWLVAAVVTRRRTIAAVRDEVASIRPLLSGLGDLDPLTAGLVAFTVATLGFYLLNLLAQPLVGWDAIAMWLFKAKVFFDSGSVVPEGSGISFARFKSDAGIGLRFSPTRSQTGGILSVVTTSNGRTKRRSAW